jgi:dihydroflavonol-4-reductase
MKALVTGATGFVGSAVVHALLAAGHSVRALVRPAGNRKNLDGLDIGIVVGDLTDPETLRTACVGCDALFHVAADYRLWIRDPQAMMAANVDGTRNIIRAAMTARVRRIVYTSSVATLGVRTDGQSADEETPASLDDMIGPYKRSKFLAEEAVREMVGTQGAQVVIVNPSAPIGPRDIKPTPTGRLIVEAAAGRMPAYVDTGLNVVHVDDVAAGHLAAYERGRIGERYILGGDNLTLRQILVTIAALTGRRGPLFRVPHGVILPVAALAETWTRLIGGDEPFVTLDGVRMARKKMFFSCGKAAKELGYAPRPSIEALSDAILWFRENGYLG